MLLNGEGAHHQLLVLQKTLRKKELMAEGSPCEAKKEREPDCFRFPLFLCGGVYLWDCDSGSRSRLAPLG